MKYCTSSDLYSHQAHEFSASHVLDSYLLSRQAASACRLHVEFAEHPTGCAGDAPVSNTGAKSISTANDADDWFSVCIDTLTFSFSGCLFGYDVAVIRSWVSSWSGGRLSVGGRMDARFNGYPECWELVPGEGLDREAPALGWLGMSWSHDNMRGRCCIHLKAYSCLLISDWRKLYLDMRDYQCKITRCDIALDDYKGVHGINEARQLWNDGMFVTLGHPPKSQQIINSDGSGDTFYVGSRSSSKYLRVYEKGKQLASSNLSNLADCSLCLDWVRWELELKGKNRDIPYEVLINPLSYIKGAYPRVFEWVNSVALSIKTNLNQFKITFASAMTYAKRQVSRLVRYCWDNGMSSDDIVGSLIARPGQYPMRLFGLG